MKTAFIRGAFLNPFELQLYQPLLSRHDVKAIGATWQFYPSIDYWPGAHLRLPVSGGWLGRQNSRAGALWNKALSASIGSSYCLRGLVQATQESDLLHSAESFFTMTYQALQIKRKRGIPLVVTVSENIPYSGETHPVRKHRKRQVLNEADAFIAITPKTRDMLLHEGVPEARIRMIPMSISLERFSPGPKDQNRMRSLRLEENDFVVLFIGRFIPEKGIEELLHIIPQIQKEAPDVRWRFCFIGEGPLKGKLLKAEKENPELVRLHPFVSYEEIADFHRLADLFVLLSKPGPKISEQFGFVLVEAMACGVPVMTTSCGSIPEVVGTAGHQLPSLQARNLIETFTYLARQPNARKTLSLLGKERVAQLYDAKKNAHRVEALYAEVLSSKKRS